jgi:hypothetical protein
MNEKTDSTRHVSPTSHLFIPPDLTTMKSAALLLALVATASAYAPLLATRAVGTRAVGKKAPAKKSLFGKKAAPAAAAAAAVSFYCVGLAVTTAAAVSCHCLHLPATEVVRKCRKHY